MTATQVKMVEMAEAHKKLAREIALISKAQPKGGKMKKQ